MARVTYGSSITELAGSIGGVTYQKNASGNTAKLRSNPTVNPTSRQAEYQANMARFVSYWPTLSQANKDLWDVHAAANDHTTPWGAIKTLSGYQWYLSVNLIRVNVSSTIKENPVGYSLPPPPQAFTIETSDTYIRVAWAPDYNPSVSLIVYASLPLRQSSLKLRRSLFKIDVLYNPAAMTNYDLTAKIIALYGVTWADFYASADCNIIIRIVHTDIFNGWVSLFESAITKIS